jgi:NAD(P) transhydrogenase subunit alpha
MTTYEDQVDIALREESAGTEGVALGEPHAGAEYGLLKCLSFTLWPLPGYSQGPIAIRSSGPYHSLTRLVGLRQSRRTRQWQHGWGNEMKIFFPREAEPETRVPAVPDSVQKLVKAGYRVECEAGLGRTINATDDAYRQAGAVLVPDRASALTSADIVARVGLPPAEEIGAMKRGAIHISHLDPFRQDALLESLAAAGVAAVSMELIPRTTLAQKMDALSSQASLAGYVAVLLAARQLTRILPMMMTPAGTISPARVFVIGAGVAGLQAIATAKRLGARVDAYDTRPAAAEQIQSLGGKALKIDIGETGQTKDGYAKELTDAQIQMQRDAMAKFCASADVVITTAQLFGRPAPKIVMVDMVQGMRPGSVIVDLAIESGGNVEGAVLGEIVDIGGVTIIGTQNLPGLVPVDASAMYASNVANLMLHFGDGEQGHFNLDADDDILAGCLVTRDGALVNETLKRMKG